MTAVAPTPSTTRWTYEVSGLYERHFDSLVGSAMRLLDTRHLAEEAVQETFLRFHRNERRPQPGSELAYLRAAVMNSARSMLRRRQVAERWRPETPRTTRAVDDECVEREAHRQMRACAAALPGRQRDVLVLRYWQGLSVNETAQVLDISPGAVKTHASRGREALRVQLSWFGQN